MPHNITVCVAVNSSRVVQIGWEDGMRSEFHALMLRDNCFCDECYSAVVGERVKLTNSIPLDISIRSARPENNGIVIHWSDGHVSKYDAEWLRRNAPLPSPRRAAEFSPKAWTAPIARDLPDFTYAELLEDEDALLRFLSSFRDFGISVIRGAPPKDKEVEKFANHLAYVREIIFDRVADIRVSMDAYTQGFTSAALHPHTDCSGYRWPPNVFLFHCLANDVEGGESVYVDGQAIIEQMRGKHPDHLDFLVKTPVVFRLYSKSADTTTLAPAVILDEWENLHILRHANWAVQPVRLPLRDTERYYRAHSALSRLIHDPGNQLIFRARPGDIIAVNNHRVLHGRNSFRAESGSRHFQQVYMEADDLIGRIRILSRKNGISS